MSLPTPAKDVHMRAVHILFSNFMVHGCSYTSRWWFTLPLQLKLNWQNQTILSSWFPKQLIINKKIYELSSNWTADHVFQLKGSHMSPQSYAGFPLHGQQNQSQPRWGVESRFWTTTTSTTREVVLLGKESTNSSTAKAQEVAADLHHFNAQWKDLERKARDTIRVYYCIHRTRAKALMKKRTY